MFASRFFTVVTERRLKFTRVLLPSSVLYNHPGLRRWWRPADSQVFAFLDEGHGSFSFLVHRSCHKTCVRSDSGYVPGGWACTLEEVKSMPPLWAHRRSGCLNKPTPTCPLHGKGGDKSNHVDVCVLDLTDASWGSIILVDRVPSKMLFPKIQ